MSDEKLVSVVYGDKRRPVDMAARQGMTSNVSTHTPTHRDRITDEMWGPTPPPMKDTVYHHPVHKSLQDRLGATFGKLTIVGFTCEPSRYRIYVVRCACGRYGTKRSGTFKTTDRCSACKPNDPNADPYSHVTNTPPLLRHRPDDRAGEVYGTLTILGRRHGGYVVKCTCGAVATAKKPERASCVICRDYVHGERSSRSKLPDWWPVNKDVIPRLDAMREVLQRSSL